MDIVAKGGVPVYDKEQKKYIDKEAVEKAKKEAEEEKIKENYTEPKKDYSEIVNNNGGTVIDGSKFDTGSTSVDDEEDIPF